MDVRRHHPKGSSTNKAFHAVGPYPVQSAMVQIVDSIAGCCRRASEKLGADSRSWSAFDLPPSFGSAFTFNILSSLARLRGDQ